MCRTRTKPKHTPEGPLGPSALSYTYKPVSKHQQPYTCRHARVSKAPGTRAGAVEGICTGVEGIAGAVETQPRPCRMREQQSSPSCGKGKAPKAPKALSRCRGRQGREAKARKQLKAGAARGHAKVLPWCRHEADVPHAVVCGPFRGARACRYPSSLKRVLSSFAWCCNENPLVTQVTQT